MKLDISNLSTERQWRSATGLTEQKFKILLNFFQASYESIYGKTIQERTSESPNNPTMTSYSELLFLHFLV